MIAAHVVLGVLWISYCFLHSFLVTNTVKFKMQQLLGATFQHYRLYYNIFSFTALIGIIIYQLQMNTVALFAPGMIIKVSGALVTVAGATVMLICIRKYFYSFLGIQPLISLPAETGLMITGIHQHVRHPLYAGTFLFIWGLLLLFPTVSLLVSNLIITFYTLIGIHIEERKLIAEYGQDYIQYRKRVPMLVPKLSRRSYKQFNGGTDTFND